MRIAWVAPLVVAACANANPGLPDATARPDTRTPDSAPNTSHCGPNELATNIQSGQVTCAPIESIVQSDVDAHCSVYLGWQDSCDGCITPPAKWGYVGGDRCMNGAGVDNTCAKQTLAGKPITLFGLNTDGDVDGNDKFHTSLHCTAATSSGAIAPCPAGEFAIGSNGTSVRCEPLAVAVVDYVSAQCQVFTGWQDNCDGCTTAPAKWGHAGDAGCMNGVGTDNTCSDMTLGTEVVKMFGLNPDGNVDDNDKLHIGLACGGAAGVSSTTTTVCPPGQFVVGVATDGSFQCQSAAPLLSQYVTAHCKLYLGWSDNCASCTTPPTKWGTAQIGACANGTGANDTCTAFTLGGDQVSLFGLNTDGDVDGNDTFYVGFTCE